MGIIMVNDIIINVKVLLAFLRNTFKNTIAQPQLQGASFS